MNGRKKIVKKNNSSNKEEDLNELVIKYNQFLENFKIEIGHFLKLAERGKKNSRYSLEARKKSIFLRNYLKENFREISITLDKKRIKEKRKILKSLEKNDEFS